MKKKNTTWLSMKFQFSVYVCVVGILVIGFMRAYQEMERGLNQERATNMTVVMDEMAKNVNDSIKDRWNVVAFLEQELSDNHYESKRALFTYLNRMERHMENRNCTLYLLDNQGGYYTSNGHAFLWEDTSFLTDKRQSVYVTTLSAVGREKESILFLQSFSKPIVAEGVTYTHIMMESHEEALDEFLNIDAYEGEAVTYVIHKDGSHFYKAKERNNRLSDMHNVISSLEKGVFHHGGSIELVKEDMQYNRSNSMCITYEGIHCFLAYHKLNMDDWYAVLLVPEDYVGQSTTVFMREIILIVSSFALYFVVILFITMWYKETQLKKRQEDVTASLREMAEMEKHANEAKTQFLSSMSHDIRTPMNAIIGTVTVASKYTHDPERIKKYLGQIEVAGNHLLTMINDILDLSKIESGQIVLSRIRFSIEEMMNDLVSLVRVQMREKGQTLDWTITNLEYPWLWGDVHRLNQIYLNLLSNAVKYTQDHGHIVMDLRQELIERKTETTNGKDKKEKYVRLTFYIQDNGIGMSKEFMGQMYDSFVRNTNSTINPVAGSGLGLCLVKQMVEIMDGTITCESEPEVGTTFVVQLDLEVAEEPMSSMQPLKKQAKENELDLSKTRILVAEDNDINWEILNEMLSMYGIQAIRAENGQVCVELFQKSPEKYDLILMDVQMPVMDGREASRKIREIPNPYAQSIPIIATTADVFVEDILICEAAGMNGHLSKPIDMNLLIEELRKRIGKGKNVC